MWTEEAKQFDFHAWHGSFVQEECHRGEVTQSLAERSNIRANAIFFFFCDAPLHHQTTFCYSLKARLYRFTLQTVLITHATTVGRHCHATRKEQRGRWHQKRTGIEHAPLLPVVTETKTSGRRSRQLRQHNKSPDVTTPAWHVILPSDYFCSRKNGKTKECGLTSPRVTAPGWNQCRCSAGLRTEILVIRACKGESPLEPRRLRYLRGLNHSNVYLSNSPAPFL